MKPTKKQFHVYCTDEVLAKLKTLADANDRSMSNQAIVLINKAYDEYVSESKNNLKR